MKRLQTIVIAGLILAGMDASGSGARPGGPKDYRPLPADLASAPLFHRRLELELRRAGGPRPEFVAELLRTGAKTDDSGWSQRVLMACRAGLVSCRDYVDAVATLASQSPKDSAAWMAAQLEGIKTEAELQGLGQGGRQALYRAAIETGGATRGTVTMSAIEAAMRALEEGHLDFIPLVRSRLTSWSTENQMAIQHYLDVAEALAAPSPTQALIELVRRGATIDVSSLKGELVRSHLAVDYDNERRAARFALEKLRIMNSPGTLDDLKGVLRLYDPVKEMHARKLEELQAAGRPYLSSQFPSPKDYLGQLGEDIVEVIGDLGDRDLERRVLGGRTLWDQVSEAEKELVRRGRLTPSAMIASDSR